ncbi:MAG TPA: ADP-ribose pyrophosphatase, partial [Burkholderiaceae bacterium]
MSDPAPTPVDAHLREQSLRSEQVYRGAFLDVRRDQVRLPDGATAQREYIVHPGAVMVVPLLDDGRLVVERQWRHPLARV